MRFFFHVLFASVTAAAVVPKVQPCGAVPPPPEERAKVDAAIAAALKDSLAERQNNPTYQVNVHWHTINGDTTVRYIYEADAQTQINVLNTNFQQAGFNFTLASFDHRRNNSWADHSHGSSVDYDMKNALRKGFYKALNIYSVDVTRGGQDPYQGFGTFPYSSVSNYNFVLDGVTLVKDVVVGGSAEDRHQGITAVHEVGHWLNLYHPFATSSCDDQGDEIADTPPQSSPSYGCPTGKDTCPHKDGVDNIHNYMDYSADHCRTLFTVDQIARARYNWYYIR